MDGPHGRHLNVNDSYFFLSNSESITQHEKCDRFDQKFEKHAWLATKNFSKSFGKRVLEELLKKRFCNFNFKLIKFYTSSLKQEKLDNYVSTLMSPITDPVGLFFKRKFFQPVKNKTFRITVYYRKSPERLFIVVRLLGTVGCQVHQSM